MTTTEPRKAYIYIRTANNSEIAYEKQRMAIHEYASSNNIRIVSEYVDKGVSSKGLERAGLKQLLKSIVSEPIDCVLIYDCNRLSRNNADYRTIRDLLSGFRIALIPVVKVDLYQTPMESFMENVLERMGKLDSKQRTEMIKRRMKMQAEAGYSMQRPPIGYETSLMPGLYVKNNTATALVYYFKQTLNDEISIIDLRKAVSRIYSDSKTISWSRLRKLVANPYYSGYISYDGNLYKGLHEPLITEENQNQLLNKLNK